MKVNWDRRLQKDLDKLNIIQRSRVDSTVELFKDRAFLLSKKDLKKISKGVWELRQGNIRLLFGMIGNEAIIVNIFVKKSQKTPLKEIKLAERRLQEYL